MKKIMCAARIGFMFAMYIAICGAEGFLDRLGLVQFIGLYILLFGVAGVCVYLSELRGVHTVRRFFCRYKKLYAGKHSGKAQKGGLSMQNIRTKTIGNFSDKELLEITKRCLEDLGIPYEEKPGGFGPSPFLNTDDLKQKT